jgi:hypothetical protein
MDFNFNPLSVALTLLAGLVLAGILGWIRRPRLIVFVPRLFSHSKISDQGQIAEISVMNRGFKTEEAVDLSLNRGLHYELIGSNNPDVELKSGRISIPRIGSADDCSILLQVERGSFTHVDIITCLSKETKGVVKTKLEDIPVTAQQRVAIITFLAFVMGLFVVGFWGVDLITAASTAPNNSTEADSSNPSASHSEVDSQGWEISDIYVRDKLYKELLDKQVLTTIGDFSIRKDVVTIPISISNRTDRPLTITIWIAAAISQDQIEFKNRRVSDKLLFPGATAELELQAKIGKVSNERKVQLHIYLEGNAGESLIGSRLLDLE